jgi:predicted Zn-dependent protease
MWKHELRFFTNMVDESMLRVALAALDKVYQEQPGGPGRSQVIEVDTPQQPILPVKLWHDTTATVMTDAATTAVPALLTPLINSGLKGSAFLGFSARAVYAGEINGHRAYCRETDAECTVSARFPDGTASGWFGEVSRDWGKLDPKSVANKAIDMAQRSKGPSAFEPGRHTAVLSPFAVAQLMVQMSAQFDAYQTNVSHATVFAVDNDPSRDNKIGLRVIDPRLRIISDPEDPAGGYTPFGDWPSDNWALPTRRMTYVDNGILQDLAYGALYNLQEGKPFNQNPWSLRLEAMPGTPLATVEAMIAQCKLGIYINRFSHVSTVNGKAALMTGVTRDGCFLIKDGKINRPVKNFRFLDSPMFALNRLVAIGAPERVPLGYMPGDDERRYAGRWPRRPMIVPPIMVHDFNFSAMSDAI